MIFLKQALNGKLTIILLILFITGLHYFTFASGWNIHDFYRRLYYIPIILAAFKFRLKGGFFASSAVVLLYVPHFLFYFGDMNLDVINQILETGMFMVVGITTGSIVEKDYRKRLLLEDKLLEIANMENNTQNILDSLDNIVVAFDKEVNITAINKKAYTFFNNTSEILKLLEGEGLKAVISDIVEGELIHSFKEINAFLDGKVRFLELSAFPLKNISESIEGVVVVIKDITSYKELEQQVRRSEKLSAIGHLASGIAHEIRNPLGIIKTIAQTIKSDIKDKDTSEGIDIILHEIDRANRVIMELLDFAKPYSYKNDKVYIGEVLREMTVLIKRFAEERGVKVITRIETKGTVVGDKDKLKQGFLNILINGIQAMIEGGNIEIESYIEEKWVVISFLDEGIGISPDIQEVIFNPFFTTREEGTGLGLAITHRIVEEHKGKISIGNRDGKGTNVTIYLPLYGEE